MENQNLPREIDMTDGMLNSICEDVLAARNLLNRMLEEAARLGIHIEVALTKETYRGYLLDLIDVQAKDYKGSDIPMIDLVLAANSLLSEMMQLAVSREIKVETKLIPILHLNPEKNGLRTHLCVEALPQRKFL